MVLLSGTKSLKNLRFWQFLPSTVISICYLIWILNLIQYLINVDHVESGERRDLLQTIHAQRGGMGTVRKFFGEFQAKG